MHADILLNLEEKKKDTAESIYPGERSKKQNLHHTVSTMLSSDMCKCCLPKSWGTTKQEDLQ